LALRLLFLLYALSGFISLGYQVAWFRIFVDWFGSTNLTFALVVCNFIGGLGCGALLSQRITGLLAKWSGISDKLRLYGLVELLVGVGALLTVVVEYLPADFWGAFPYQLEDGIWVQSVYYQIAQVGVAMASVFIPCLFMGVTFPLLCDAFRSASGGGRFPAALYAWNTLGACSSVLACQFVLILSVGHKPTFWLMAGLNVLLGIYFLVRGRAPIVDASAPSEVAQSSPTNAGTQLGSASALIVCAALSGLLAGALEGDMFKRIGFIILLNPGATMSFISFWAVLGIFLASTIVQRMERIRLVHIKVAYALAALYYLAVWQFSDELTYVLGNWPRPGAVPHFPVSLSQLFVYTGIYVLPSYFLVSLLLPYVCNRLQSGGKHLGLAYGLNTVAFCLGMIAFTLVAPHLSIFYSLKLFLIFMVLAALALVFIAEWRPVKLWQGAVFAVLLASACIATPRGFDRDFFTPLMWPHDLPAKGLRSNAAHTTYFLDLPNKSTKLFFGRLSMSGTSLASQKYMRLMAHFPLLAHPNPQKVLLICFGVGNTASAIAAHKSVAQIDAVDLNENVFKTAPELAAHHASVHLDPRLRMINDDGRNFLNLSTEVYDLITSEPPPPMAGGVYRLYSREYYEQALAHLSPNGLMTQWLPASQMPPAAISLVMRTFVQVFPHSLLFEGADRHLILLGSRSPIDLERLSERFYESQSVTTDLYRIEVWSPDELLARVVHRGTELRRRIGAGRVLSDQHNDLEHLLYDPARQPKR
jgi:spermidine synthase